MYIIHPVHILKPGKYFSKSIRIISGIYYPLFENKKEIQGIRKKTILLKMRTNVYLRLLKDFPQV